MKKIVTALLRSLRCAVIMVSDPMVEISMAGSKLRLYLHQPQQLTKFHNEQCRKQKHKSVNNSKIYLTDAEIIPNAELQQYLWDNWPIAFNTTVEWPWVLTGVRCQRMLLLLQHEQKQTNSEWIYGRKSNSGRECIEFHFWPENVITKGKYIRNVFVVYR